MERRSWCRSLSPLLGSGSLWSLLIVLPRWPGLPGASLFQLSSNSWPFILSVLLPGLGQNLPVVQYPTDFSYQVRYLFLIPFNLFYQCAVTQVKEKDHDRKTQSLILSVLPPFSPGCIVSIFPSCILELLFIITVFIVVRTLLITSALHSNLNFLNNSNCYHC